MKAFTIELPDDLAAILEREMERSGLTAGAILGAAAAEVLLWMDEINTTIEDGWARNRAAKRRQAETEGGDG